MDKNELNECLLDYAIFIGADIYGDKNWIATISPREEGYELFYPINNLYCMKDHAEARKELERNDQDGVYIGIDKDPAKALELAKSKLLEYVSSIDLNESP